MARKETSPSERVREPVSPGKLEQQIAEREEAGWSLVALEWQRPEVTRQGAVLQRTEVPYGLQVSRDFLHLEENPAEVEAMVVMLDLLVEDVPLSRVAQELNRRGFRTREGTEWTAARVFDLVPRLVEVGPDVFGTHDWAELREQRRARRPEAV